MGSELMTAMSVLTWVALAILFLIAAWADRAETRAAVAATAVR